uniref:ATP synthase complex subunit 8 n=1 Tax=Monotoma quadricollis TaxID=346807 RepID=A0A343A3N7_9CUCU|nr:ATP synthase F0 subunit 8 [Monotoma quadricollis]AOY39165.1 ATP synthase F0 subunit 8 [Monotoma quadricollis]
MPQMMPLNWLTLMIFFISVFLIFNMINYFSFIYKIKKSKISKTNINFSWKW